MNIGYKKIKGTPKKKRDILNKRTIRRRNERKFKKIYGNEQPTVININTFGGVLRTVYLRLGDMTPEEKKEFIKKEFSTFEYKIIRL